MKIRELAKQVSDKIAAGEVIEKPLSIIKELLENAIDSGADTITVEIKNGGKSYIRVADNGCGISSEEVEIAFKRHATGKIDKFEDLQNLFTLGFRGEALASIAAVSKVELITKTKDNKLGTSLQIQGGDIVEKSSIGCPDGTVIIVKDIFFNTPARLKFMKSDAAEGSSIIEFVSKMAFVYSNIKIKMISNNNVLFNTSGKNDLLSNILLTYGSDVGKELLTFSQRDELGNEIRGFVSPPSINKVNKKFQIYFVNGRYVNDKIIDKAVTTAYKEKIFDGRFPIAFLVIDVLPQNVDVNIHPNKTQIKFSDEQGIFELISNGIKNALDCVNAIPDMQIPVGNDAHIVPSSSVGCGVPDAPTNLLKESKEPYMEQTNFFQNDKILVPDALHDANNPPFDIYKYFDEIRESENNQIGRRGDHWSSTPDPVPPTNAYIKPTYSQQKFNIKNLTITGSVFGSYITAFDEEYFYLIDQHAAHERIYYEKFMLRSKNAQIDRQQIFTPILFEVSAECINNFKEIQATASKYGFTTEEFGGNTIKVNEIPAFMEITQAQSFLQDFFDSFEDIINTDINQSVGATLNSESVGANSVRPDRIEKIISRACKSAVKANNKLNMEDLKSLMEELSHTDNPYSCPHGRPVFIKMSQSEIEKMFKRK